MKVRLSELEEMIAVSLYVAPCTPTELKTREFLNTTSEYGIDLALHYLDVKGEAIFYRGKKGCPLDEEIHCIRKSFMRENGLLEKYELQ